MDTSVKLLTLFLCIHSAAALQCWICSGPDSCSSQTCSSTTTHCFSDFYEVSHRFQNYSYSSMYKGCAESDQCQSVGGGVHQISLKVDSYLLDRTCCDTDNCNAVNKSALAPSAGSLQCYTCFPYTFECAANLSCGPGESCFQSTQDFGGTLHPFHGCISENQCNTNSSVPFVSFKDPVSCCNTSHCNAPDLGLQCQTCTDSSCSSQRSVSCSKLAPYCYSGVSTDSYTYGSYSYNYSSFYKGCATASVCAAAGFGSYNYGSSSRLTNTTCCDSDDCNAPNLSSEPPAGSLQCYGCDPYSYDCSFNVTCNAQEICSQTIFTESYGRRPVYGCVSENLCSNSTLSQQFFSSSQPLSCCNTSFCNVPAPTMQCSTGGSSVSCPFQTTACYSKAYTESYGAWNYSSTSQGCDAASVCTAAGSQLVSYNYGSRSYFENITCCDSDNCNDVNVSVPVPSTGSLQCYGCDQYSYECTANLSCNAQEVCGQAVYDGYSTPRPFYGCVSENLCNNPSLSQRYLGFYAPVSCCNTSNCNVPDLGLQCQTCTDSSCSSQRSVSCSKLAPYCYSGVSANSYTYGSYSYNYSSFYKGCATASVCAAAGFGSYNYGSSSHLTNTTCCDSDDCNAPNLSSLAPPAGSLQCYGCAPYTNDCTSNVTCSVLESCFHLSDGSSSRYGCVSENLCHDLSLSQNLFYSGAKVSCCDTNLCNAPTFTGHNATSAPPLSAQAPPRSTQAPPTTDGSVFSGAEQVLAPALLLSLLLLCVLTCHSELTH